MASQVPPKKNTAFGLGLCLYKNDGTLIANPGTLTAKISKDFGDYADIGTTSEEDSTYGQIKLALTATEMNADVVMIYVKDNTSGCVPFTATIYTAANLMDDIKTDTAAILADTGTDGVVLAADAITAAKIADDAISSEHVATGALTADAFAANAITNSAVADDVDVNVKTITAGAITATAIADNAIDLATFAADCKTGSALKANVETISANAITATAINADAITEAKIADAALSTEHFNAAFYTRLGIVAYGTAQSATSTTLVLAASSALADDELNGAVVVITGGTGVGQSRVITNYTGSTDTAEVDAWTTTPSGTITYVVFAAAPASATSLPAVNLTQIAGSAVSTSTAQLGVNVVQISEDATAADNAELMFDGTGYAGGTIKLGVDAVAISGDTTAADNAESFFDGTGYAGTNNVIPTVTTTTSVTSIGSGGIASTSFQSGAITASAIATGAIDADALATDAVDEIVDGVWNEGVSTHSTPNTYGVLAGLVWEEASSSHATVGTLGRKLNDASNNSAAILADTGTDGVVVASIATGAINSDALDSTAVVEITTATWNEALASHTTPGTAGKTLTDLIEDTGTTLDALVKDIPTVSEFNARTLAAADYVVVSDTLAGVTSVTSVAAGGITASSIATGAIDADALSADAVAEIADGVWDESLMGHVVAGTAGKGLGDTTYAATLAGVVVGSVSAGAAAAIADGILDRDMSTGSDSGSATKRTVRQALRFLRNKWEIVTGTLTVYKENDSTASWTSTVGSTSGADPVTSNDPASS